MAKQTLPARGGLGSLISRIIPQRSNAVSKPAPQSRYGGLANGAAGDYRSSFLFGWTPRLREPVTDTLEAWADMAARGIDAMHNSGWISGAVDQSVVQMVGSGLSLNCKPQLGILGAGTDTDAWARQVEEKFEAWASSPYNCDLGGRASLGQIAAQGVRQFFGTGEQVGTIPYKKRPGNKYGTKVNLVPSMRLSQRSSTIENCLQGVVMDDDGAPIAYRFWRPMYPLTSVVSFEEFQVLARDGIGRPGVFHLFDNAPGAVRGISPLAPVLKVYRQVDQLADATLTAGLLQTIFAATVESSAPTEDILRALQDKGDENMSDQEGTQPGWFDNFMSTRFQWYKNTKIDLGQFGKIMHLFPGEKLNFNRSEHPNSNYEAFNKWLLREIMRGLGITYEQGTGDYVGATYSSIRMGIADQWLMNLYRRALGPARLYQMVFECWLEEAITIGEVPFPSGIENYWENAHLVARCDYRGPPKPTADDLKTNKAYQIARAEGWLTTEQIASEFGNDWRDNYDQLAKESEYRNEKKLAPLPTLPGSTSPYEWQDPNAKPPEPPPGPGNRPPPPGNKQPPEQRYKDARRTKLELELSDALISEDSDKDTRVTRILMDMDDLDGAA